MLLLLSADFSKVDFQKLIQECYQSENSLDQDWHSDGHDLGPNCLQRLSADENKRISNTDGRPNKCLFEKAAS